MRPANQTASAIMDEPTTEAWYALHVRSQHEKMVFAQLDAKRHEAFLPMYSVRHRWSDRWKTVSMPLFPGYVFCRFDVTRRSSIMITSGVIDLVRSGAEPAPIENSEIETVRAVVASKLAAEPYGSLVKGQSVKLVSGPLTGATGTLVEIRKNFRFVVSVQLLNRSVSVDIDQDWVAPNP
jgi:transcription antitermination factor NusG